MNAVASRGRLPFRGRFVGRGPAYWQLIHIGRRYGLAFVLGRRSDWDGRSTTLRRAFSHDGKHWLLRRRVRFDAIMPRTDLRVRRAPPLVYWNQAAVWKTCADKWLTYRRFRGCSPRTWLVASPKGVAAIRSRYPRQSFVVKPRFGRQSRGVVYLPPGKNALQRFREPMILQEAIVGGAIKRRRGVWDIRCFIQNGRLDLAYLKQGSADDPILNVHRGSRIVRVRVSSLPTSTKRFVRQIDQRFARYHPRHYCIDFRYSERGRPMLIELNHLPVLPWHRDSDYWRFYRHLCQLVLIDFKRLDIGTSNVV